MHEIAGRHAQVRNNGAVELDSHRILGGNVDVDIVRVRRVHVVVIAAVGTEVSGIGVMLGKRGTRCQRPLRPQLALHRPRGPDGFLKRQNRMCTSRAAWGIPTAGPAVGVHGGKYIAKRDGKEAGKSTARAVRLR